MSDIFEQIERMRHMTEEELDKDIFRGSRWENMPFQRQSSWDGFNKMYASPIFLFENGDKVVVTKEGNLLLL